MTVKIAYNGLKKYKAKYDSIDWRNHTHSKEGACISANHESCTCNGECKNGQHESKKYQPRNRTWNR